MDPRILFTGLKAVDLFAPIPLGGDVFISGEPKAGSRIVGMEMAYRLSHSPEGKAPITIFLDAASNDAAGFQKDFPAMAAGSGEMLVVSSLTAEDIRSRISEQPSECGDVMFAVTSQPDFVQAFRDALRDVRDTVGESFPLTSFVVTEESSADGFDAKIISKRMLAAQGIYPALDPREMTSAALSNGAVSVEHEMLVTSLSDSLAELLSGFYPDSIKDPKWEFNSDSLKRPALQTLKFISQPMFCAEAFTGLKSAFVPLEETIATFQAIISGQYADSDSSLFWMKNSLVIEPPVAAPADGQ